jgi:hypothetical protein
MLNWRLGPMSRWLAPGWSWCYCCGTPWLFVRDHTTWYREFEGTFPLCEKCWGELTPETRWPYYEKMLRDRPEGGRDARDEMLAAVLAGR